ncbi:MAG: hypothetical protein AAGI49_14920 [Bacteroidota bacterium]
MKQLILSSLVFALLLVACKTTSETASDEIFTKNVLIELRGKTAFQQLSEAYDMAQFDDIKPASRSQNLWSANMSCASEKIFEETVASLEANKMVVSITFPESDTKQPTNATNVGRVKTAPIKKDKG